MQLTQKELDMLDGKMGFATQKAMQILNTLGEIYGAERLIPVSSVQVAGVSYDNLGEAGLSFLSEMAHGGGKAQVLTTLNPAGMDIENWQNLGISEEFAINQNRVLDAFASMEIITTCSCTPYLIGNAPHYGEHIAWSESSAVCFANSVIGARSNREGGPSALAASLTGRTPAYGMHLDQNRFPTVSIEVDTSIEDTSDFGALGIVISNMLMAETTKQIPIIFGIKQASVEHLKSFCASIATYSGTALFHMSGITPEADSQLRPKKSIRIGQEDIVTALRSITDITTEEVDFVSLGCPHLSIKEIAHLANLLSGKKVTKEFWFTTARATKNVADQMGYTQTIESSGAKFAADTCCVVAPIKGRFNVLVSDSAKACYYAASKHDFKTKILPFDEVVQEALR